MQFKGTTIERIRHSLSHILAIAVLERWPEAKLGVGPTIESGFYYDFELPETLTPEDLPNLEKRMRSIIGKKLDFSGQEVSIQDARKFFQEKRQPYKLDLLDNLEFYGTTELHAHGKPPSKLEEVSLYRTGDFIDLCRGGHVRNTKEINPDAFRLTKVAGAYWRGSEKNQMLTRIYGIAFETKKELNDYFTLQEEVMRRDHRKLGESLQLFAFYDVSPGAPFWLPKGMVIFKELEKIWRQIHEGAGYQEISTPILVKEKLFQQSGHTDHYKENMLSLEIDKERYYLKPMNCPESTLIYSDKIRSYRDLPIRFSEIGRLHRNELTGTLGGLLRVRQITMDDAHIFCRPDQILSEISGVLRLIKKFYGIFKIQPTYGLATKPDKAMGEPLLWERAEQSLAAALKKNGLKYELKPKDGAFYGPKIDVRIKDALGRDWQLGTAQLDFQTPERFALEYTGNNGAQQRAVMIHRAIFGSFERFFGILVEHYGGAFPLWLSPVQVSVIPVGTSDKAWARQVEKKLIACGIRVEVEGQSETVSKKIRGAELQKIPYILVVGPKEKKAKTVRVRERKRGDIGMIKLDKFTDRLVKEIQQKK